MTPKTQNMKTSMNKKIKSYSAQTPTSNWATPQTQPTEP